MIPINLSDNLDVGNRMLHLQTHLFPENANAIMTLFDHGQVRAKEQIPIPQNMDKDEVKNWVSQQHQEFIETITFLFSIDQKVRSIKHGLSLAYLGDQYLHWGFFSEALQVLKIAWQVHPECIEILEPLCGAYIESGDPEKAIQLLSKILESVRGISGLWKKRGEAYLMVQKYKEAFLDFKQSVSLEFSSVESHLYLVLASLFSAHHSEGVEKLSREKEKQLCMTHLTAAFHNSTLFTKKDFDTVLQHLQSNDIDQTIKSISSLLQRLRSTMKRALLYQIFYLQFIYGENGRNPDHIKRIIYKMESLIKHLPQNHQLRFYLGTGYILLCRDKFQRALEELHSASKLAADSTKVMPLVKEAEQLGNDFIKFIKKLFQ